MSSNLGNGSTVQAFKARKCWFGALLFYLVVVDIIWNLLQTRRKNKISMIFWSRDKVVSILSVFFILAIQGTDRGYTHTHMDTPGIFLFINAYPCTSLCWNTLHKDTTDSHMFKNLLQNYTDKLRNFMVVEENRSCPSSGIERLKHRMYQEKGTGKYWIGGTNTKYDGTGTCFILNILIQ